MNSFSIIWVILFMFLKHFAPIQAYSEMHDSLAMEIIPQLLCTNDGECSTISVIPSESETSTIWDQTYDDSIQIPVYEEEDPWFQLVANRFHAIPPLSYQMKTVTPVTNIVRLPDRHVIRPNRHRPIDLTRFPVSATSKIDTFTSSYPFNSPLTPSPPTTTSVSTPVSHVVLFKLLLLIAFVAVPIVASTLPIIMPYQQMTRSRRDDVIVNWATHSATLIALAHLASDDRLPELLKLHDEAFVEALTDALITPLENNTRENEIEKDRTKNKIGDSVLKLLRIVKSWDDLWPDDSEEDSEEDVTTNQSFKTDSNNVDIKSGKKLIDYFINHRTDSVTY